MNLPFVAGETDRVVEYADREIWALGARLGLDSATQATLHETFMAALRVNAARMQDCLEAPLVESVSESRDLFALLGRLMIAGVDLSGIEHMARALKFMAEGGNVLLLSNHTSGADTLVLEHVVNTHFADATRSWLYMAGHVVNLYLLPVACSSGVTRVQIFSTKYCAAASDEARRRMHRNNARALLSLAPRATKGGTCVVLYPEGGRGNGALLEGDPKVMKIAQILSGASPNGLMILPSYVEATEILPVVRGDNEFNEFLEYGRRGSATLRFGAGAMWNDLQPDPGSVHEVASHRGVDSGVALKQLLHQRCMGMIASLAPEGARGPHEPWTP